MPEKQKTDAKIKITKTRIKTIQIKMLLRGKSKLHFKEFKSIIKRPGLKNEQA